jgi:hypothetical protein
MMHLGKRAAAEWLEKHAPIGTLILVLEEHLMRRTPLGWLYMSPEYGWAHYDKLDLPKSGAIIARWGLEQPEWVDEH